jgi:hypothetical protein
MSNSIGGFMDKPQIFLDPLFFDGVTEINANNAFLSETIVCPVFLSYTIL